MTEGLSATSSGNSPRREPSEGHAVKAALERAVGVAGAPARQRRAERHQREVARRQRRSHRSMANGNSKLRQLKRSPWRGTCACRRKRCALSWTLFAASARRMRWQILRFAMKRASRDVEKVLRSAIANAERKAEDAGASLDVDHLFVSNCYVNEGSRWKRLLRRHGPRVSLSAPYMPHRRGVAEHHVAAKERVAAAAAEAESQKGVAGAVKKARQALAGKKKAARKPSKK